MSHDRRNVKFCGGRRGRAGGTGEQDNFAFRETRANGFNCLRHARHTDREREVHEMTVTVTADPGSPSYRD